MTAARGSARAQRSGSTSSTNGLKRNIALNSNRYPGASISTGFRSIFVMVDAENMRRARQARQARRFHPSQCEALERRALLSTYYVSATGNDAHAGASGTP